MDVIEGESDVPRGLRRADECGPWPSRRGPRPDRRGGPPFYIPFVRVESRCLASCLGRKTSRTVVVHDYVAVTSLVLFEIFNHLVDLIRLIPLRSIESHARTRRGRTDMALSLTRFDPGGNLVEDMSQRICSRSVVVVEKKGQASSEATASIH